MYVGATRARDELHVVDESFVPAGKLDSGRVYFIRKDQKRAQIEFGREGDLDPISPACRSVHNSEGDATQIQSLLASLALETRDIFGVCDRAWDFKYRLYVKSSDQVHPIGDFYNTVNEDLWTIIKEVEEKTGLYNLKPPDQIMDLYMVGARTVVIPEDHPDCDRLHHPYAISGVLLAPVIKGFPSVRFPFKAKKWRKW